MICPRCNRPNDDDSRFCLGCGLMLVPPKPSPFKTGFFAFLRAICYYFLFIVVQTAAIFAYSFFVGLSTSLSFLKGGMQSGDYAFDTEEATRLATELLMENLHIILILSALITILILFISFRIRRKEPLAETHIRPISPKAILPALLFGAALQVFTVFTLSMIPIPQETLDSFNQNSELLSGGPLWLQLVSVVIVTPIIEEMIFRGLVFSRLNRGMRTWLAVILSAAIFGSAHGHIISFVYAGLLGVCLAILMKRQNNSIIAPILCHAGFNGTSYLLGLLGEDINTMLFFALYLVSIALCVLCAYLLFKKDDASEDERVSDSVI